MDTLMSALLVAALIVLLGWHSWTGVLRTRETRGMADSLFTQEREWWKENMDRMKEELASRTKAADERMAKANAMIMQMITHPSQNGVTDKRVKELVQGMLRDVFKGMQPKAGPAPNMASPQMPPHGPIDLSRPMPRRTNVS